MPRAPTKFQHSSKNHIKQQLGNNLGLEDNDITTLDSILFVGSTKNSKYYGNISFDGYNDECNSDEAIKKTKKILSQKGLSIPLHKLKFILIK